MGNLLTVRSRHGILAIFCAFALVVAACGDDDDSVSSAPTSAAEKTGGDQAGDDQAGDDLDDDTLSLCLAYLDFWSAVADNDDDLSVEASALLDAISQPGPGGVTSALEAARDGEAFTMGDVVGYIDPICPEEYKAQSDFGEETEGN